MKKKKIIWGTVIALSVVALAGANIYRLNKSVDVTLAKAEQGAITETVFASGQLEPSAVQSYFAPGSGIVAKLEVKLGDKVKKGQALYSLRVEELEQQLRMERNNLKIAQSERDAASKQEIDLTLADLKLENAKLTVEALEKKIAAASVTAQQDGVVTKLEIEQGQMLMEGAPSLVIADLAKLQVRANLGELDANKVKQDLAVNITGDAFDKAYRGKVIALAPTAGLPNPTAKDPVVEMIVALDESAAVLRPGYGATVEIELTEAETHPLAPLSAVKREGEKSYLFRVEKGKAVEVEVKTGKEDEEHVEILEGIGAGDEIIASVSKDLKAGKKVSVQ